ncbi:MAG: DUF1566 domain-containing protein [Gammaproteobacteria bacterium]|nr:DUF1566 domain-containing protein [Gammaproteobacteria bacterium]
MKVYSWEDALTVKSDVAGFDDWRLPTRDELQALVDCGENGTSPPPLQESCESGFRRPTINQDAFPDTLPAPYWSASARDENPLHAWNVDFNYGITNYFNKSGSRSVRLVREVKE